MSVVSDRIQAQPAVSVAHYDAVVVGAGPYGLTIAAHLLGRGLNVAIFGKPLELWREHMPKGMNLRSHWWATNLSDPGKKYSFERFFKESSYEKCYPLPIEAFVEYGLWYQKQAVPQVDETYVANIERIDGQFMLTLVDGRVIHTPAVVMAIGVYYYAHCPAEYTHLTNELVSHGFDHKDFKRFAGKDVAVIGAGQSAVEYSALLHEAGASVRLIARRPIHWLDPDRAHERTIWEQIKAPTAGIAPGWRNWALEYMPYLFYHFPQAKKDRYVYTRYTAAASDWLRPRVLGNVALHEGEKIERMIDADNGVSITLTNNTKFKVDHVILGTGYKVNINRLSMLHPSLLAQIQTDNDIPLLNPWFESNVPGLYFVGLSSIRAFGPLFRFVVGNKATAERVAGAVVRRAAHSRT